MTIFAKVTVTLLFVVVLVGGYLYLRHPFVFQELAALPVSLAGPDLLAPDPTIDTIAAFDTFVDEQLRAHTIPGAAVALVRDGEVVWSKGYGFANVNDERPVTADTPFMIASVSKAVMGVALMHAVENNTVALDADINDYLDFTVKNPRLATLSEQGDSSITLRHLATHTSGITDRDWLYTNSYSYGDPVISLEAFLRDYFSLDGKQFRTEGNFLDSAPGKTSAYSNIGAGLAGHVIGAATGQRLDVYAREHIFIPLGMTNTGWFLADFTDPSQIAQPHAFANRAFPHYGYPTWPDGQLRTSANDLARLLAMVMNGGQLDGVRILETETVDAMLTKQQFPGLAAVAGEGIFWSYTRSGMVGHNGGDHGATTAMYINPATNTGVVVLSNASPARAFSTVLSIARQVVQGERTPEMLASL